MKRELTVETITHKNVQGKELQYLRISNGKEEHLMNVGEATIKRVEILMGGEENTAGSTGVPKKPIQK